MKLPTDALWDWVELTGKMSLRRYRHTNQLGYFTPWVAAENTEPMVAATNSKVG